MSIFHCFGDSQNFDHGMVNIINISVKGFLEPLLLALVLVELQNTCKKKVEHKNASKTQHMLYF